MTKVQAHFHLQKQLDDSSLNSLAHANAIYGIYRLKLSPAMDGLMVEYDATRLRPAEVESALANAGIPIQPREMP
jgi:allophanate hydrolase subunit 1